MKIVIASPFVRPEKGACIFRMNEFEKYFSKKGHSVLFFAPARGNIKQEKGVKRYKTRRELWSLVKKTDFDVLIGTSPPMTNSFVAMLAAKLKGKPVVLDVRDPWTYAYEGLGIYGSFNPKLLLYKLIERISYVLAEKIFSVTTFTSGILERAGANRKKIVLVPNGTIPSLFKRNELAGKKTRKKLGLKENSVVLLYAGAFVKKDLDKMLKAISSTVKSKNAEILLALSIQKHDKAEFEALKKVISETGLENKTVVVNFAELAYSELYKYFSASDIGLNPLPEAMDYCIPAKTYDYFASGLPVIGAGPKKSALRELIEENNAGWYFGSWKKLEKEFPKIISSKMKINSIKKRLLSFASEKFDRQKSGAIALNELAFLAGQTDSKK